VKRKNTAEAEAAEEAEVVPALARVLVRAAAGQVAAKRIPTITKKSGKTTIN